MKSPRFLAALAMAAVLATGVATTAHASSTPDFKEIVGSGANGQTLQQGEKVENTLSNPKPQMNGDIQVDGTFTKRINNFPTPTTEGRYLRVTMPIKMDFTYDVDTHDMKSADAVITNNSVLAKHNPGSSAANQLDITDEKIEMTVLDFEENTLGANTMGTGVEFVTDVATAAALPINDTKVLLPFQLQITSPQSGALTPYTLETIVNNPNQLAAIEIPARGTVQLKLGKIPGQELGNGQLLNNHTSLTSHNLKLKFEYKGN